MPKTQDKYTDAQDKYMSNRNYRLWNRFCRHFFLAGFFSLEIVRHSDMQPLCPQRSRSHGDPPHRMEAVKSDVFGQLPGMQPLSIFLLCFGRFLAYEGHICRIAVGLGGRVAVTNVRNNNPYRHCSGHHISIVSFFRRQSHPLKLGGSSLHCDM